MFYLSIIPPSPPPTHVWEICFSKADISLPLILKINFLCFSLLTGFRFGSISLYCVSLGKVMSLGAQSLCIKGGVVLESLFRSDLVGFKNSELSVAPPRAPAAPSLWLGRTTRRSAFPGARSKPRREGRSVEWAGGFRKDRLAPGGLRGSGFCSLGLKIH